MNKTIPCLAFIIICFASTVFAQTTKPRAYKFVEFEEIEKKSLTLLIDAFLAVLQNSDDSQGFVVNYGSSVGIKNRKKLLLNSNRWSCGYGGCRITFVVGPKTPKTKTIFWVIPNGANPPKIDN